MARDDPSWLGVTVAVFAHPDDEAYLAGGVLASLRDAGQRVVCVTATRGEAGNGLHAGGTPEQRAALAAVRSAELAAALDILGVTEHRWLDYSDGELDAVDPGGAVARVVEVLDAVAAETVVSFGPDGITGHPDHCTVAAWAALAVDRARRRPRLLQAVVTESDARAWAGIDAELDVYALGGPRVVADDEPALRFALPPDLLARKVAALRAQASQTAGVVQTLGEERFATWVGVESFAYAEDQPYGPVSGGVSRSSAASRSSSTASSWMPTPRADIAAPRPGSHDGRTGAPESTGPSGRAVAR
jgi:LmbE family N-acetylglucosaminyl deacetylase